MTDDLGWFSREEFACKCGCGQDTVDYWLIHLLNQLRDHLGPTTITSGNRCPKHNKAVGGSKNSQHLLSRAADVVVEGVHPDVVADYADLIGFKGVGRYDTFTHVDTRTGRKARWQT